MLYPHDLGKFSEQSYMEAFASLYEHAPWVAQSAYPKVCSNSKYNDLNSFHQLLSETMLAADGDKLEGLILAHPLLAGKKMQQNVLTEHSTVEQKSAGLNSCNDEEIALFNTLNQDYVKKHSFPFILAVMGRSKIEIIDVFKQRINNETFIEYSQALEEINKIAGIRIQQIYTTKK